MRLESEFRLLMVISVMISTCIGLMGFGWSASERDSLIVSIIFLGVISFGCLLGSTTSIMFVVDNYRQYAGEALVTLSFSKTSFMAWSSRSSLTTGSKLVARKMSSWPSVVFRLPVS